MRIRIPMASAKKRDKVENLEDLWGMLSRVDLDNLKSKTVGVWCWLKSKHVYFLAVGAIFVIVFVVGAALYHFQFGADIPWFEIQNHETAAYWGQIGDFVGGILNPLLSFVAFLAVLINLVLQRQDLSLAREEAREANKNQRLQSRIFEKQNAAVERQNFESTFFRLLDTHRQQASLVKVAMLQSRNVKTGEACFDWVKSAFLPTATFGVNEVDLIKEKVEVYSADYSIGMSTYFKNLHQILKFIESYGTTSGLRENALPGMRIRKGVRNYADQRVYASILRAQLSNDEMCCIFINCLSDKGSGLKYFVEKFSMLKGVQLPDPYRGDKVKALYQDIAYADGEEITREQLFDIVSQKYGIRSPDRDRNPSDMDG
ncbi:putative phage abortive infection protein [Pseudomonas promysalinigenes]|uniref:putative phage abortive infection protein n=1 Tax=Pseudomonas promysalinigenes TaxID=485898 RepID=UPI0037C9F35D